MSKFSILIANYNNGKYFQDCFQSIIAQTEKDWEAVILDDCSTDDSIEIIKEIIGEDVRFKIHINEKNQGVGFTKRSLVELASSEICGFVDPDDALEQNAIEMMLKAHSENPKVGLVYSNFTFCDEFLQKIKPHQATQITELDEKYYNFNGELSHFATLKKSIYNKTSGIDPYFKIAEDKDWYMKMCEVAPVLHLDESLYLYRLHDGGISTNVNAEKAFVWHIIALIKMSERRKIDLDDFFFNKFILREKVEKELLYQKEKIELLKKSRLLKILNTLGVFKAYKYL